MTELFFWTRASISRRNRGHHPLIIHAAIGFSSIDYSINSNRPKRTTVARSLFCCLPLLMPFRSLIEELARHLLPRTVIKTYIFAFKSPTEALNVLSFAGWAIVNLPEVIWKRSKSVTPSLCWNARCVNRHACIIIVYIWKHGGENQRLC